MKLTKQIIISISSILLCSCTYTHLGKTTINSPTELKDNAMSKVQRQQQELIQTQENQETLE